MAAHFFCDSDSLMAFVRANDEYVRHGDVSIGSITFIDCPDLHVAFDHRDDYEHWCELGCPAQLSFF